MPQFTLTLEHAISYTPCSPFENHHNSSSIHFQPINNSSNSSNSSNRTITNSGSSNNSNNDVYIYIAGASVCISKLSDANEQEFLRGHDDQISTLAISRSVSIFIQFQSHISS